MLGIVLGQVPAGLARCTLTPLQYLWRHAHAVAKARQA